jgi:hypothetical protein
MIYNQLTDVAKDNGESRVIFLFSFPNYYTAPLYSGQFSLMTVKKVKKLSSCPLTIRTAEEKYRGFPSKGNAAVWSSCVHSTMTGLYGCPTMPLLAGQASTRVLAVMPRGS